MPMGKGSPSQAAPPSPGGSNSTMPRLPGSESGPMNDTRARVGSSPGIPKLSGPVVGPPGGGFSKIQSLSPLARPGTGGGMGGGVPIRDRIG